MYPDDLEIEKIVEQEDGSAIVTVHMSMESLKHLAEIGLLKLLTDEMEKLNTEPEEIDTSVGC